MQLVHYLYEAEISQLRSTMFTMKTLCICINLEVLLLLNPNIKMKKYIYSTYLQTWETTSFLLKTKA